MGKKIQKSMEQLFLGVKDIIESYRARAYRSVNAFMVQAYWNIGKLIVEEEQKGEQRAEYGKGIVESLAMRLQKEYGKGYNKTNLWYMRQFYQKFNILHSVSGELSWTHYRQLLKVEKDSARVFYMEEAVAGNWSTRTLERQINSLYYERILVSGKEGRPLVKQEVEAKKEMIQPIDIIKDPYVLEFLNLKANQKFYEQDLEQAIIERLQEFLLELGKGFCFVARQYRVSAADEHFRIDLVFYNYILKCFLLIDLKTGKLTHQDIGQMDMYVRYFEDKMKQENDNPTIGLILCTEKNHALAKYSLLNDNKQIFASKYKLLLPTEEELERELERERNSIEMEKSLKN